MQSKAAKILLLILSLYLQPFNVLGETLSPDSKVIVTPEDKLLIQNKIERFLSDRDLPIGDLAVKIGRDFLGTPYVAKTLDMNSEESLVVNLRELDCTTFVESCLALARTVKSSKPSYKQYLTELENIRYRNGKLMGYTSRLHYFSEWISNKESMRLIDDMTFQLGGVRMPINLNLMTTKTDAYPQLKSKPELIEKMKIIEEDISSRIFFYIPTKKFEDIESEIQNGDIAAMTSPLEGIDILHVGFLFRENGKVLFLHASSSMKKVVISDESFRDYLKGSKRSSGVMIARPIYK